MCPVNNKCVQPNAIGWPLSDDQWQPFPGKRGGVGKISKKRNTFFVSKPPFVYLARYQAFGTGII